MTHESCFTNALLWSQEPIQGTILCLDVVAPSPLIFDNFSVFPRPVILLLRSSGQLPCRMPRNMGLPDGGYAFGARHYRRDAVPSAPPYQET